MSEKVDRRIAKSQKAIQAAFLEMLLEIGFDAIMVKDITEKADVSRKTFYLHYMDKFDLLNSIVNIQLADLTRVCEEKSEKGFIEGTVIWFEYFEQRKLFFAALFATESTVSFRHRLLTFIMEQLSGKLAQRQDGNNTEVLCKFLGTAVLGVVESCVLDQFKIDTEQVANKVGALLEQMIANPAGY